MTTGDPSNPKQHQIDRVLFSTFLSLLVLLLVGCEIKATPESSSPLDAPFSVVPEEADPKDPTFVVTSSCPSFGNYVFDVRYSPPNLTITQAGSDSAVGPVTCSNMGSGHDICIGTIIPSRVNVDFMVCYSRPGLLDRTCEYIPITLSVCPAYVPNFQLVSINCEPDNNARIVIDWGTTIGSGVLGICPPEAYESPDGKCVGMYKYDSDIFTRCGHQQGFPTCLSPRQEEFISLVPPVNRPLYACNLVQIIPPEVLASATEGLFGWTCQHFDDFYSRYIATCTTHPTPTTESQQPGGGGGSPPPACSSYSKYEDCKNSLHCYWWASTGGTCEDSPEPPPPSCGSYTNESDCTKSSCQWWYRGTCEEVDDPCANYTDKDSCTNAYCSWLDPYCLTP